MGKVAVVGAKDRATRQVATRVVESTDRVAFQGFVTDHVAPGAVVYTDDTGAYESLPFDQETTRHSLSEYVKGGTHATGIESLCSRLNRTHKGTFHKPSPKHLDRYVQKFAGWHDRRDKDTIDIMASIATGMRDKKLRHRELIADNGLPNGAWG